MPKPGGSSGRGAARGPRPDRSQRAPDRGNDRGAGRGPGGAGEGTSKLDVPSGAREPVGRDRARQRRDAPVRARRTEPDVPPRPPLPDDEQPQLPRDVARDIERTLGKGSKARDIALALSIGSAAIDEERPDVAVQVLAWAKHEAPRITAIREAYGVALYLADDFAGALSELQAYRRMSGRVDQNHVVADCLRALGRGLDQIADAADALVTDPQAPEDRRAEAAIVWGAALADDGDLPAGRAVLRRFLERPRSGDAEHDLRVRYLAADLAQRADDPREAMRQLELIVAVHPSFLDAADRLDAVRDLVEGT